MKFLAKLYKTNTQVHLENDCRQTNNRYIEIFYK